MPGNKTQGSVPSRRDAGARAPTSCKLALLSLGVVAAVLAATLATLGPSSVASGTPALAEGAATHSAYRVPAASCVGGQIKLTEEDYYGAPSKTNPFASNLETFFQNYSRSHPCVKVEREAPVTQNGDAGYLTHVLSQFSAGSQPDLLMLDNPQLAQFASTGVLVPLHSLGALQTSELNPANVAETTYQGQLYALPLYTNTIAIFYNKTLLRRAGITKLPTTWAQFGADAKKLAHGTDLGFVFSGQAGPGQATWQFDPWAWTEGAAMSNIDTPGAVQALSFLASLVKEGAAPKDVVNWSQAQPIQEFEAGKAAFAENGLWNIPVLKSQFPHLQWGDFEIPTRVPGQTVIPPFGGEVWSIPKTNPAAEKAAFALLKTMGTPSELASFARLATDVPTDPKLWDEAPWNESVYAPFLTELRHGRSRTAGLKDPAKEPQISLNIGNAIEAALIGKETAAQALKAAQQANEPLLH
jgi:multiple sugar transport system substrate-binding protein